MCFISIAHNTMITVTYYTIIILYYLLFSDERVKTYNVRAYCKNQQFINLFKYILPIIY
jgi:hypothetical protein